jgi:hypothetical protein
MIDVENAVFNRVAETLRNEYLTNYPGLKVYGEYVEFPESFPCVSLWCTDNYSHLASRQLASNTERYANVMFSAEVYTTGQGRKALAKTLANRTDELMRDMGFTRNAMMVLPNVDRNAFRITLRYAGLVAAPVGEDNELISLVYR